MYARTFPNVDTVLWCGGAGDEGAAVFVLVSGAERETNLARQIFSKRIRSRRPNVKASSSCVDTMRWESTQIFQFYFFTLTVVKHKNVIFPSNIWK
jgi:hypothetical protein